MANEAIHAGRIRSRPAARGTSGSNPVPSSRESVSHTDQAAAGTRAETDFDLVDAHLDPFDQGSKNSMRVLRGTRASAFRSPRLARQAAAARRDQGTAPK